MAEHDPKVLIKSQAFVVLNILIDTKIAEIRMRVEEVKFRINRESKYETEISVRTYEERGREHKEEVGIGCNLQDFEIAAENIARIHSLRNEIGELQRFKFRLLDDYDFTKGDNSDQVAVFGEPVDPLTDPDIGQVL